MRLVHVSKDGQKPAIAGPELVGLRRLRRGQQVDSDAYVRDAARALVRRLLSQPPFGPQATPTNAPTPAAARVTISEVGGTGSLDAGAVRAVVNRSLGRINRCYAAQLSSNPSLRGSLTVTFTVGDSGTVSTASVSAVFDGVVDGCVLDVVRHLRLPAPLDGPVTYTSAFVFAPDR